MLEPEEIVQKDKLGEYVQNLLVKRCGPAIAAFPFGAPKFTPDISGVRVTRSLVLCVCFVDRCFSFCLFSFGHCVVCPSSIYGF
jgi:hypothetical protein